MDSRRQNLKCGLFPDRKLLDLAVFMLASEVDTLTLMLCVLADACVVSACRLCFPGVCERRVCSASHLRL